MKEKVLKFKLLQQMLCHSDFLHIKETVGLILSDPLCNDSKKTIHNGTNKSFVWSSMNCISMLKIFENWLFSFGFINRSDLRISAAEKHTGIIRIEDF